MQIEIEIDNYISFDTFKERKAARAIIKDGDRFYLSADLRAISSSRAVDRKMERTFQKHFAGKLWRRPVMK